MIYCRETSDQDWRFATCLPRIAAQLNHPARAYVRGARTTGSSKFCSGLEQQAPHDGQVVVKTESAAAASRVDDPRRLSFGHREHFRANLSASLPGRQLILCFPLEVLEKIPSRIKHQRCRRTTQAL